MSDRRFDSVLDISGAGDWQHDPWGTAIGLQFDIAEVLDANGISGDVLTRWQYRRGLSAKPSLATLAGDTDDGYSYGAVCLATALMAGDVTVSDLTYAGDVLARYVALLDRAGYSY